MLLEGLVIPVSFDTGLLLKGIDLIKDTVEGAVEATFEWAEGMDKLGDITGMSGDKLAAWSFVAKKAGVPVETLSRGMVIMEKGLVKADGSLDTMGKTLKDYGINVLEANGKVRDQSDLMNNIAAKYSSFSTQQERVNFLTAVFGRNGAELVDVFDTLSNEGGIDAVTKKVQDMGLAIDPARYEEFQRSLEELKMAGLGLQVAFTEKLMPVLEELLGWGSKFMEADWSGKMQMLADSLSKFNLPEITQKFRDWVDSVDWFSLSTNFALGMNKVDWGGETRKVLDATVNILQALIDIVNRTNWQLLGQAIRNALVGIFRDGIGRALAEAWTPAVQQFWRLVDNTLGTNLSKSSSKSASSAGGGATRGRASGGSAGGLTWVGERGPELVNLPGGSFVHNAQQSQAMQTIDYDQMGKAVARHLVPALQVAGIG